MNVSVRKTVALLCALTKLHNFCVDSTNDGSHVPSSTVSDQWRYEMSGAVLLVQTTDLESNHNIVPQQFMNGGHHFDGIGGVSGCYNRQQQYYYASRSQGLVLPRQWTTGSSVLQQGAVILSKLRFPRVASTCDSCQAEANKDCRLMGRCTY